MTRYEVRDETGVLVAVHCREDQPDGDKRIWWEKPDGTTGLPCPMNELPLFGANLTLKDPVVIAEGEKATEALWAHRICALGTYGAGTNPADLDILVGRRVVLWPDADDAGRLHMRRLQEQLQARDCVVYWLEPPESAPQGWDAADGDKDMAIALIGEAIEAGALPVAKVSDRTPSPSVTKQPSRFRTARQLADSTPETVDWIVEPWLPAGASVELAGKIKASGKTTLALALCRAVTSGTPFLARAVRKGPVVYLTEQPDASFRIALGRARLDDCEDFHFLSYHGVRGMTWSDVMDEAIEMANDVGAALIVVDTLAQFAGMRGESENDAGAALAAMEPVQAATGAGLAVLLLRHERKGGGEVGESARGSSAFAGVVDVLLRLARPEGNHRPGIRRIDALSRFDETPDEMLVELMEDGTYTDHGTAADLEHREALEAIRQTATEPMTDKELTDTTGLSRTSIRRARDEMLGTGELARSGSGKRGDPYRVVLAEKVTDHTVLGFGHKAIPESPDPSLVSDQTSVSTGHKPRLVTAAEAVFGEML